MLVVKPKSRVPANAHIELVLHEKGVDNNGVSLGIYLITPADGTQVFLAVCCSVLQCAAVCCSVLQCSVVWCVCCGVLRCFAVCCSVMQCVAMRGSVLQCAAVCCCVLQCVAVTYRHRWHLGTGVYVGLSVV